MQNIEFILPKQVELFTTVGHMVVPFSIFETACLEPFLQGEEGSLEQGQEEKEEEALGPHHYWLPCNRLVLLALGPKKSSKTV